MVSSLIFFPLLPIASLAAQTVINGLDTAEPKGQRPYEMVWAGRVEEGPPTVRFDQLTGWSMEVSGGAEASLQISQAEDVWNRPVARLRYRGNGQSASEPRIVIAMTTVAVPSGADCVEVWLNGNRWDWENPPDTPPVRVILQLRDSDRNVHQLAIDRVRWKDWWVIHKRLPPTWKPPLQLEQMEFVGGWQQEWRTLYLDSIRFYREDTRSLTFQPRPRRNLSLSRGQSVGANSGPGSLPFPTREETILPLQLTNDFSTFQEQNGNRFHFHYRGPDCTLHYSFDATVGLDSLTARIDGQTVGRLLEGSGVRMAHSGGRPSLIYARMRKGVVTAVYVDGTALELRLMQKSLVADVRNPTGDAVELDFGHLSDLISPRTIWVPYLNYGNGPHPSVLLSKAGVSEVFTSIWLDWYRSNGSEPFAAESTEGDTARINGGVRYLPRTDGARNPMFERFFVTVSPSFEEVLPRIPNPVGLHAHQACERLWQETWGPADFAAEARRSQALRAYGIEKLIQCNHEIAWRDGGESFTLRVHAAPKKGGDSALQNYVRHQTSLGWLEGLYSNYTDYAPVNEFWSPDGVQRGSDGSLRTAWPRCYALKPLRAVEYDALLAPQLKAKYASTSAYTDVHTAVAPWGYTDYDARVPGAGTFAQTFYAYGELLRNDSKVYGGPIFSEGTYQWLYAGLADGNYALAYDGHPMAEAPLLPIFDLYEIHSRECDIGMGWTENFCSGIARWKAPENLDRSIDRFLLNTLAYGHIGWLVEEAHGISRTCRSYYMLQAVQARYGLKRPSVIGYWDGATLRSTGDALIRDLPRQRRQLYLEYPGNLRLWLNDSPTNDWTVDLGTRSVRLPPSGWAASQPNLLETYSGLDGSNRVDYIRCEDYVYLDGRGHGFSVPEATANGALAIRQNGAHGLEVIHISGDEPLIIRRPFKIKGRPAACEALDLEGNLLPPPRWHDAADQTQIELVEKAVRYRLRFVTR